MRSLQDEAARRAPAVTPARGGKHDIAQNRGAARASPQTKMTQAVTQQGHEAWQDRENSITHVATDQIPSLRIACIALESRSQVRRLLGIRIVAGLAHGLSRLSRAAVAFGDARLFRKTEFSMPVVALGRYAGREEVSYRI